MVKKKLSFYFKCSLVLLPLSLVKLIKSLNIDIPKLPYPYKFINKDNLNYEGNIPSYYFYNEIIKYEEYLELSNKFNNKIWNLKNETIKYLKNDVNALYEIISKFSKEFYELESIDITKSVSISSLALKIFLANYYNQKKNTN